MALRGVRLVLAVLLPLAATASPVFIENVQLFTTHDMIGWKPDVYFQCEGEGKKFLTGVVKAHQSYNFSLHESFQPLTELESPKCKRCGLYEADTFTEDDVFQRLELCPLDFSEGREGRLVWDVPREMNLTFLCYGCNTKNMFADGVIFSNDATSGVGFIGVFTIVLGCTLGISLLLACITYFVRERLWGAKPDPNAKFMEMFEKDSDGFLSDDEDFDIEADRYQMRSNQKHEE